MSQLLQDVRYGFRTLAKSPGFTLVAVVALAFGIGANTAMFSYVNAWVLHPLPYPHTDRLVLLIGQNTKTGSLSRMIDAADFYDLRRSSRDFEEICAWRVSSFNLTGDGAPERIDGYRVSWNFFETLGAKSALGRTFLPQEDAQGAGHVAILSRGLWETRFAGDPQILGRKIKIDAESYEVVGIMPSKFQLPLTGESNVWIPLALSAEERTERAKARVFAIGRLNPGTTLAQAQGELSGIASQFQKAYPNTNANLGFLLHTLEYEIGSNQGNQEVLICFLIVALVLLMACANVANLMLARATGRTQELAVRTALGARRLRLVRQLVTETVLLFLIAGGAGLAVAHWTLAWLAAEIPARVRGYLTNHGQVSLDYQTLLYTLSIAFVAGVVFGLAPAISGSKLDVFAMLKEASGRASGDRRGARLRNAFVIAEIALAVVVVVCSAVLARSFLRLIRANPGFRPQNVMAAQLDLPKTKYKSPVEIRNFYDQLTSRLHALPHVDAAAASQYIPFGDCCAAVPVFAADKPAPRPADVPYAEYSAVTPQYFSTMGISLAKGRYFAMGDGPSAPPVIIINQTLANYFWRDKDPIGQKLRFTVDNFERTATVAGIVGDVKLYNSTSAKHDRELYTPFEQFPSRGMGIVVRSSADPSALANAIRGAVWAIDTDQPVSLVRPIQALMDDQYSGFQIVIDLMGFFSALAVFLGAIGIYAVMAFNVTQRTHEIGIRMALGAHPREILRFALRSGAWLTATGIAIGTLGALGASRVLNSLLFGVSDTAEGAIRGRLGGDPLALAGGVFLLVIVAFLACYVPARRAMRVDPLVALRYE
jgi:putative ABC transport system permease protein